MSDLTLLAAVLAGALCTLIAFWALSIQRTTRELTETAREIRELARALRPTAERLERLGAAAEESEPDLRRIQRSLGSFSQGTAELGEAFARTSHWIGVALPLVIAAVERWQASASRDAEASAADVARGAPGNGAARPAGYDEVA